MQEFTHYVLPIFILIATALIGYFFGRRGVYEAYYEEGLRKGLERVSLHRQPTSEFLNNLRDQTYINIQYIGQITAEQTLLYLIKALDHNGRLIYAEITTCKMTHGGKEDQDKGFPFRNGNYIKKNTKTDRKQDYILIQWKRPKMFRPNLKQY